MATFDYATFVIEYTREVEVIGTGGTKTPQKVEKEGVIACLRNVAVALGLQGFITTSSSSLKTIAATTRTNTRVGGVFLGTGATAAALPVQSYSRGKANRATYHGRKAKITFTAVNANSAAKSKTHPIAYFSLPSGMALWEINIALSLLFSDEESTILGTNGIGGLIKPSWHAVGGGKYNLITDTAALTTLATSKGIKVASAQADVTTIDAATGG
jgi:hypothetical protein